MPQDYTDKVDEFNAKLRWATLLGLTRMVLYLHAKLRQVVSISAGPVRRKRVRSTVAGKRGSTYTVYEDPSAPGEAPHKRTGTGQSNIVWESNDNVKNPAVRVGVRRGGIHMLYLELGTQHIAPRPWLLETIMQEQRRLGLLAMGTIKGQMP